MEQQAEKSVVVSRSTLYRWRTGATQPSARLRDEMARTSPGTEWGMPFESGTWVRAARRAFGLSQAEFALPCGVTQSIVSKWENGGLKLAREAASELHSVLDLPPSLDPTSPNPCESDEEVAGRYAEHTSSLIIQSELDADWRAAQLCSAIAGQANRSVESGRVLAGMHSGRSLWHLVNQDYQEAARHAQIAIRLGRLYGFNVASGYALWSLARTRFLSGFGSTADIALLDKEVRLAESKSEGVPRIYGSFLRGARANAIGDCESSATELARAEDQVPSTEPEVGVVGRWDESYWRRDIALYHAMLALCSGRFSECCQLIEQLAEEPFAQTVATQYSQSVARHYYRAANARLGCRESMETDGPLVPRRILDNIKRHTARLAGHF
jgi:transcriptional regulator with XRE-family HTH domain